jgi:hypothetical protein
MLHASTQRLILALCNLTADGKLQWREGENASSSRLESEGYVVEVSSSPLSVRILNNEGRVIEIVTESDLAGAAATGSGGDLTSMVRRMADSAQRVARGTERAIAAILSSLSAPPLRAMEADSAPAFAVAPLATHADNDDGEAISPPLVPDAANDDRAEAPPAPSVSPPASRPMRALPGQAGAKQGPRLMFGAIPSFARVTAARDSAPAAPASETVKAAPTRDAVIASTEPYKPWS